MLPTNNENLSLFGDLLNNFRSQNNFGFNPNSSSSNSFLIAGSNPGNKYYSLSETDAIKRRSPNFPADLPITPIQHVRRGINDALINTGNMFGQDFSGSGSWFGVPYLRPDYRQN
jgi:hypothetical protein